MVSRLKEPHELAGKQLTTGSCPECKKPVAIRANKNGIAYFYCAARHPATGDQCNHHGRFSTRLSSKLCTAYLGATENKIEPNEPANDNRPPLAAIASDQGPKREPESTAEPEPTERRGRAFGRRRSA